MDCSIYIEVGISFHFWLFQRTLGRDRIAVKSFLQGRISEMIIRQMDCKMVNYLDNIIRYLDNKTTLILYLHYCPIINFLFVAETSSPSH